MKKSAYDSLNNLLERVNQYFECADEIILTSILEYLKELNSDTLTKMKSGIDFILNERDKLK